MPKHILTFKNWSSSDVKKALDLALKVKASPQEFSSALKGKTLGMVFEKPSTRTRLSFEVGMSQLGGQGIYIKGSEIGFRDREPVKDIARVMSRYLDGVMIRTKDHTILEEFIEYSSIPVINGLSDLLHPCQAMADVLTMVEKQPDLENATLAYLGDGNNVCQSLIEMTAHFNFKLNICTPSNYQPDIAGYNRVSICESPEDTVKNADFVYTDVWVSMGQESETQQRLKEFQSYQVNRSLLEKSNKNPYILHCLPANRGQEITDDVMESSQSIVFDQAENRLHAQKALLLMVLGGK